MLPELDSSRQSAGCTLVPTDLLTHLMRPLRTQLWAAAQPAPAFGKPEGAIARTGLVISPLAISASDTR